MLFFEIIALGSNILWPPLLQLFKHEFQTIFRQLFVMRLHSFHDLLIGLEFPSPKRNLDFGEQAKVTRGQIWTVRWMGYSFHAASVQEIHCIVSNATWRRALL